jgi:hypothetical protein
MNINIKQENEEKAFVPKVFLSNGKFNAKEIHWLTSYIEHQLYLQMCETKSTATADVDTKNERKVNWYYFEAAKYAGRISAGDFSGQNAKYRPIFRLNREDFCARLKAELAKLPKETIHRIVTEAVFRIFRARHKMIFYQYIENERLRWEFI